MAQVIADRKDVDFVLHEQLNVETLGKHERFSDFNKKTIVLAWMLLWRSIVASRNLEMKVKKKNRAFYEGQLKSAQFFINSVLPVSLGKMNVILSNDTVVADITAPEFGG